MRARAKALTVTEEVLRIRKAKLGENNLATIDAEEDIVEMERAWLSNATSKCDFRLCSGCEKVDKGLKKCPKCKQAWWCNEDCQSKDQHTCALYCNMLQKAQEKANGRKKKKAAKNNKGQKKKGQKPKK
jgi:hypothetical protein